MDPAEWLRPCVSTCTPKRTWPWQILSQPGDGSSQFSAGKPMEKPMETHGKNHGKMDKQMEKPHGMCFHVSSNVELHIDKGI